jgi:hypothetical protein
MANSAADVTPSSLNFVRHDPDDGCCTCILCLVKDLRGEEWEEWTYSEGVDLRLDYLAELEVAVKQQPAVLPAVLTDQEIKSVVRGLSSYKPTHGYDQPGCFNLIEGLDGSPKESAMWELLWPLFRDWDEDHRPHISAIVSTLSGWHRELNHDVDEDEDWHATCRLNTFPILIVAEAFCKGKIKP